MEEVVIFYFDLILLLLVLVHYYIVSEHLLSDKRALNKIKAYLVTVYIVITFVQKISMLMLFVVPLLLLADLVVLWGIRNNRPTFINDESKLVEAINMGFLWPMTLHFIKGF